MNRTAAALAGVVLLAAAGLAASATSAQAPQASAQATVDTQAISGGAYTMDPTHSAIAWRVGHFKVNDYFGMFGSVSGKLALDKANPGNSKVEATIPVSKVVGESQALTDHLLRPAAAGGKADFFGANPADAKFVSTMVHVMGTKAQIMGDLTLNGVTKPVTIDATLSGAGAHPMTKKELVGFHGTATIKRSDFGVLYGIPLVDDAVRLDISVAFQKD